MKKGLNVTLMTVAIAVMAFQAMGRAPVIGDIKSPIVGANSGVTGAVPFVYPDAFNIESLAADDTTAQGDIRWSYSYEGDEVYRINNVDRVALDDAAITEPGDARINGTTDDPDAVDSDTATITIRNVKYAPIGETGTTASGTFPIDVVTVTLFASDGTTFSLETGAKDVIFYTDPGGNNRLSVPESNWTPVMSQSTFPTEGEFTWTSTNLNMPGTLTIGTSGGTAICLDCSAVGQNFGWWQSNMGIITVQKNTVYRIRAKINGTQTEPQKSPFIDLALGNLSGVGLNLFGADFMIFDNEGGANAPMLRDNGGADYYFYWAPAAMLNDTFNDSTVFSTANTENRGMFLMFRTMDINSNAALTADEDSGNICMNEVEISSIPNDGLQFEQVWATDGSLAAGDVNLHPLFSDASFDTGKVKIAPSTAHGYDSKQLEYGYIASGDGTVTTEDFSSYEDDYPVAWEADTLYRVTWYWSAQDANSEDNPLDAIWTSMDSPTNELILSSYVTSQEGKAAMPKMGDPQPYIAYYYSHNISATTHDEWKFLRPRAEFANSPGLTESDGSGTFFVHGAKVEKVTGN